MWAKPAIYNIKNYGMSIFMNDIEVSSLMLMWGTLT